jgi:hypothetical protein
MEQTTILKPKSPRPYRVALSVPLEYCVRATPQDLESIRQDLFSALILVKTEMVAALAITLILYDNDGVYYIVYFGFLQHLSCQLVVNKSRIKGLPTA